jgi:protein ImuA
LTLAAVGGIYENINGTKNGSDEMTPRVHKPHAGRSRMFLRHPTVRPQAGGSPHPGGEMDVVGLGQEAGEIPSLTALRRTVAALEGRIEADARLVGALPSRDMVMEHGRSAVAGPGLRLDVPAFDDLFPHGLPLAGLTEIRAAETRHAGAMTGFCVAMLVRIGLSRPGPILWARSGQAGRETGMAAGLGLVHLGFDPSRLLVVRVREAAQVLWAMEEGLGCAGLAAVVGELHGPSRALDLTASRRLALRARESGVPALLVGHAAPALASAAAARMCVTPRLSRPAGGFQDGPGFPAWTVTIEKNRTGRTGRVDLEWNSDDRCFRPLAPLPVAVAADAPDGSARPLAVGQIVAHPSAVRRAG